ncbi:MAG: di-trans,poly-cis-decaprenylcistransferase [Spirochaetales bacterium]|nr:di-trans,poly-cis-decaprenylcistransferase [Spirochaetales bacterium]
MPKPQSSSFTISRRNLPRHVGIIMDGNGRWAVQRNKPRHKGHIEGLESAKRVVKAAAETGLKYVSLYTFSTENWKRAEEEVSYLMFLVKKHLKKEYQFYRENNIRIVHSGETTRLQKGVVKSISETIDETKGFDGLTVNLALNYGGRDEIIRAVGRCVEKTGHAPGTEKEMGKYLDQPNFPDADLIIRTGGEQRLSNFLLWQSSYAEFYFSDKLWPDWSGNDLTEAILDFQKRKRRFGNAK